MRKLVPLALLSLVAVPAADAKRKPPKKGPTPKIVRTHMAPTIDAVHTEGWMTEDQVTVRINRIRIGKPKWRKPGTGRYDPHMWQWPVKAEVKITTCRTPDTCETETEGSYVPDLFGGTTIYWFDKKSAFGGWRWAAASE